MSGDPAVSIGTSGTDFIGNERIGCAGFAGVAELCDVAVAVDPL